MGRSEHVRTEQVIAASRLAAEAREIALGRGNWQRHIADGLVTLFDAQLGCVPEVEILGPEQMALRRCTDGGHIDASDRSRFLAYMADPDAPDPTISQMLPLARDVVCARRDDLVPDAAWRSGKHFNEYRRPARLDPVMFGFVPSNHSNWFVGMGVHRAIGEPSFDRSAPVIFRVVCEGVAELCRTIGPRANLLERVPPRRRAVLERLLAGDSERQAAHTLGMSEHAVHAHVKAIHKQFGVRSRGELFARFMDGGYTTAK